MRTFRLMFCIWLAVSTAFAQQGSTTAKPASKSAAQGKPAGATADKSAAASASSEKKAPASGKLPTTETVSVFLKKMFGYDPNLVFRVAEVKESAAPGVADATVVVNTAQGQQVLHLFITPDQQNVIVGEIMPFGVNPFQKNREALITAFGATQGPKDAAITIVEFGDLQCPACKAVQPNIEKLMKDEPNAKLIFQNYPLETIHPWAGRAARYLDCIARNNNDAGLTFITAVYAHQGEIVEENVAEKLNTYAKMAGADPTAIEACSKTPETDARVKKSIELGSKVGITGTPTLFVNGRRVNNVGSMPYETLKAMVDYAVEK